MRTAKSLQKCVNQLLSIIMMACNWSRNSCQTLFTTKFVFVCGALKLLKRTCLVFQTKHLQLKTNKRTNKQTSKKSILFPKRDVRTAFFNAVSNTCPCGNKKQTSTCTLKPLSMFQMQSWHSRFSNIAFEHDCCKSDPLSCNQQWPHTLMA